MTHTHTYSAVHDILITPGEPAGIGPELTVRALQHDLPYRLIAVCDPALLRSAAKQLNLPLEIFEYQPGSGAPKESSRAGQAWVYPINMSAPTKTGTLNVDNASYVVKTLEAACDLCLDGTCSALVTGPVQKSIISDAGIPFSGHTEFFAERSNTDKVVMMLATEGLRVALATTHLPLRDVADAITQESLKEVITILVDELTQKFAINQPRILICGLNPHAGEGGHLGHEEIDTIIPVIQHFQAEGVNLVGPLPADTLFTPDHLDDADAVLAMYHDQGLPVLKFKGFGRAINITLGLPFIRTSVDHGTALNIAGKGIADLGSLDAALQWAYHLAQNADTPNKNE